MRGSLALAPYRPRQPTSCGLLRWPPAVKTIPASIAGHEFEAPSCLSNGGQVANLTDLLAVVRS